MRAPGQDPTGTPISERQLPIEPEHLQETATTVASNAEARAERGLAAGTVPLGFRAVPNKPNYREVDPEEQPIVELVFRKFLELKKLSLVADYLNENGYCTKEISTKDGKKSRRRRWLISTVHYLLTNRAYRCRSDKLTHLCSDKVYHPKIENRFC